MRFDSWIYIRGKSQFIFYLLLLLLDVEEDAEKWIYSLYFTFLVEQVFCFLQRTPNSEVHLLVNLSFSCILLLNLNF